MADVIFTVAVPFGTGGGYYIDGVQKPIVPVVTGATFRFNQNDSTNNGHPLILSTTTSTAGIISTGVVYYLDGISNSTNYLNTALFNAATVRYVEITVSQTTDFFYICNVHGSSMGNSMDVTLNTWSALNWGDGAWNEQNNSELDLTGLQISTALGSENAFNSEGWGRLTWGSLVWGEDAENATVSVTTPGTPTAWGHSTYGSYSWGQITAIQSEIGDESIYNEQNADAALSTNLLTLAITNLTITGNANLTLSTNLLNTTIGIISDNANTIVQVTAPGDLPWGAEVWGAGSWGNIGGMDISQGGEEVVVPSVEVNIIGNQLNTTIGTYSIIANANLNLSTNLLNISLGNEDVTPNTQVTLSTNLLTLSQGFASGETLSTISVTGVQVSSQTGILFITAWAVVDIGVTNNWSVVDIAA